MIRIPHLFQSKKKIFNELVDERIEKITDLDGRVNSDNLIYRYKNNNIDNVNFYEFDNALTIANKIREGKKDLADVKNKKENFKSLLKKIKIGKKPKKTEKYFV